MDVMKVLTRVLFFVFLLLPTMGSAKENLDIATALMRSTFKIEGEYLRLPFPIAIRRNKTPLLDSGSPLRFGRNDGTAASRGDWTVSGFKRISAPICRHYPQFSSLHASPLFLEAGRDARSFGSWITSPGRVIDDQSAIRGSLPGQQGMVSGQPDTRTHRISMPGMASRHIGDRFNVNDFLFES